MVLEDSLGDDAVIVQGTPIERTSEETLRIQKEALFSTVHDAGRVMSCTAAAGKGNCRTRKTVRPGLVTREMMEAWL